MYLDGHNYDLGFCGDVQQDIYLLDLDIHLFDLDIHQMPLVDLDILAGHIDQVSGYMLHIDQAGHMGLHQSLNFPQACLLLQVAQIVQAARTVQAALTVEAARVVQAGCLHLSRQVFQVEQQQRSQELV